MPATGAIILNCRDVFGNFLEDRVEVVLRNQTLQHTATLEARASRRLRILNLHADTNNLYQLQIFPRLHEAVGRFVTVSSSTDREYRLTFPIDKARVLSVQFPRFDDLLPDGKTLLQQSPNVLGAEGQVGPALYAALPDLSRAGLLNILAKCNRTRLNTDQTILSQVTELLEVRGDRFFARVPHSLREDVKNSALAGLFQEASDLLHHPPEGFAKAGSWKTPDNEGNLQLSFFANSAGEWRADIDIDDANGLGHVFQVIRNVFTGGTHPYDIHQILNYRQELDPGYRFVLG